MSLDLTTNKPQTIGLVLDFFNPRILEGAHAYLKQHSMRLDPRWSIRGDWTPQKPGWDGVIYNVVADKDLVERVQRWKMPRVSLSPDTKEALKVVPNYEQCGYLAAKQLVEQGAKSLLIPVNSTRSLETGYATGASIYAREHSVHYQTSRHNIPSLNKLLKIIMGQIKRCDFPLGLCHPHAGVAYSLQNELIAQQIRIPEDVSMVVIDKDAQRTPALSPVPLTTVELDSWHQGFVAAEMVHHQLMGKPIPAKHLKLSPKGITHRASTGHAQATDQILASALDFVRKNYLQSIDVGDVVEAVGSSRRIVEMRFRETLNRGIHQELTRLRIEEAKRQITSKDTSITAIAENCGFSSVHYFSAAFKREAGISPKQYQKKSNSPTS